MKKFTMFSNYLLLLVAVSIFGLTACGDDPILSTEIPPTVVITADAQVSPGGVIMLNITGSKGDADMNLLTIQENGVTISLDPTLVNNDIGSGDALLTGVNTTSFNFTVEVRAPSTPDTYTYSAIVRDANGNTDEASVDVIVISAPPTISYMGTNPREVALGLNGFNITATPGGSNLSTIAVFADGELIDPTELRFNGTNFDANPYSLSGDDQTGFDMASVSVNFTQSGTANLSFEVEDLTGETASTEVSVIAGTPITNTYRDSLLSNADGPADVLGGLNLYTGENVSVNSPNADIIDLGIVSSTDPTWRQQISGANGTTLRAANSSSPELFNFENINSREAIIVAFENGVDANPSEIVQEGNVFMANNGDDYFILTITDVQVTSNNNRDFYLLDIKTSVQ